MPGGKPRFAYLLLKEHPYGREMLRQLLSEGFVPSVVITEDSEIATEEREKFLKRIEGNDIAPEVSTQLAELEAKGIIVKHVSRIHKPNPTRINTVVALHVQAGSSAFLY